MTATNHDDQLGEIYPMMLSELNCTFGVSFTHFHCCGRHGHGLWPSWLWPSWYVAVMVNVPYKLRACAATHVFERPRVHSSHICAPNIVQD